MKSSEEIIEISKALNKMQAELDTVSKDAKGYNYKYADYASIWGVLREPLTKNGLSIIQDANSSTEGVSVTTRLLHVSGQWIEFGPLVVPMGKKDAHSTGSAITYARRYGLSAALGVVPDDDDGVAANRPGGSQDKKQSKEQIEKQTQEVLSNRKITEEELELLEMYLEGNEPQRRKILEILKNHCKVDKLEDMPYRAYKQALNSAKIQYQERHAEQEEAVS